MRLSGFQREASLRRTQSFSNGLAGTRWFNVAADHKRDLTAETQGDAEGSLTADERGQAQMNIKKQERELSLQGRRGVHPPQ
jgi:hypothetical protein